MPRHFLADHQAAHGGGHHGHRTQRFQLGGQRRAEQFHVGHMLEGEGALEKLAAVQPAAEDEVAFEQRAALPENREYLFGCHGPDSKAGAASETVNFFWCES